MDLIRSLASRSTDHSLILDIGANVGGHTNIFLEYRGFIHAFEPCPVLAIGMLERFKNEPRVTVFQQGVSDHRHTEKGLTVFEAWTLGKADAPNKRGPSLGALDLVGKEPFDVSFTTIDDHVHGMMQVDFIKLDTDGYELRALKGGMKTILQYRPNILIELGYLIEDVGDSIEEFMLLIFRGLAYRIYDDQGKPMDALKWRSWYPFNTTRDYAMVPCERLFPPKTS